MSYQRICLPSLYHKLVVISSLEQGPVLLMHVCRSGTVRQGLDVLLQ